MAKPAPGRTATCMCGDADRTALQRAAQNAGTRRDGVNLTWRG